jgi:hypothetical protein
MTFVTFTSAPSKHTILSGGCAQKKTETPFVCQRLTLTEDSFQHGFLTGVLSGRWQKG